VLKVSHPFTGEISSVWEKLETMGEKKLPAKVIYV
jgi:hypothetical protein